MNYSYWEQETFTKSADIAIVGSGIVGLSAAIYLKQSRPSLKIIVIERGVILTGASLRNAGFACFGSPTELLDDLGKRSWDDVFALVERRWKGLLQLRDLLGDDAIEYEALGGYEIYNEQKAFEESKDALPKFNSLLKEITGVKETYRVADEKIQGFGLKGVTHLIENRCEGQLNTGKMMEAFIRKAVSVGIMVINGVTVKDFKEDDEGIIINTDWQAIKAKRILLATNAYTPNLIEELDIKPARAQVLITEPIMDLKIKGAFHYEKGYYYFRNVGNRLLFGGGRNLDFEGESTTDLDLTEVIQKKLEQLLSEMILPGQEYKIAHRWSGIMGLGMDTKAPIIKALSEHVYCAVRLGGMGVALGTLVGQEACNLILKSY